MPEKKNPHEEIGMRELQQAILVWFYQQALLPSLMSASNHGRAEMLELALFAMPAISRILLSSECKRWEICPLKGKLFFVIPT